MIGFAARDDHVRDPSSFKRADFPFQPEGIYKPATYDPAMRAGNTLYVAGQVARDANGVSVAPGDAAMQAQQIYHNLAVILEAAGAPRESVVKV